jgi:hypothetical protein
MVVGEEHAQGNLVERAGGLERLSRADALEIAGHLAGRGAQEAHCADRMRPPTPVRAGRRARRAPHRRAAVASAWAVAAAFELGRRAEIARRKTPEKLGSPADVAAWATPRLTTLAHEELWMLGVDGRGYLRGARCVAKGGLHGAAVRAADPLRAALRVDACAFLLVHNHPSGDPTPSKEDVFLTSQVAAAAEVVGLALLDHVVVARGGFACVLDGVGRPQSRGRSG